MGCDIHSVAQVCKNGQWQTVSTDVGGGGRSYRTFGHLASVRDRPTPSMGDPKGWPNDFIFEQDDTGSKYININGTQYWLGEHSFSWHSLADIQAHIKELQKPKHQIKVTGFLDEETYLSVVGTEKLPDDYYEEGHPDLDRLAILKPSEYLKLKKSSSLLQDFVIEYTWYESELDWSYLQDIEKDLQSIANTHKVGPKEVRFVFGFDS